jgi:exodeoxyribonuclease-5
MTGAFAVAALDVPRPGRRDEKPSAAMLRDAEAECVADACSRLIGNVMVRDEHADGGKRPCRPGDIALLAPTGTDLWRFEQALEDRGISVSTQAGKGFFRRQEVADLIALTRTLADARDTLALGALLRGPLVGLTEGELLDIADPLPPDPDRPDRLPCLDLRTGSGAVRHALARSVLEALQSLLRRARSTTPYALLADAIAALNVRPQLRQRFRGAPNGPSPMSISFWRWRAPTTCADCAHSRATCGRIGPTRCARWREGRMPRRMRSRW